MSYYDTCAFAKPKVVKKKKKQNGYKDKPNRICHYTGEPGAERHEIFGGSNRQISIDHGFQVDVSPQKHELLQKNIEPWARMENERWKIYYQAKYERRLIDAGATLQQAREIWIKLIGRGYI